MTSRTRPLLMTGASLLTAATMITATPVIAAAGNPAVALHTAASSSYELLSSQSSAIDGLLPVIEKFLASHETAVRAFAAKVPSFTIGPVTVGNAVLAGAYYDGYKGSATGLPGVIAYVESQILPGPLSASAAAVNVPNPALVEALILKLTATIAPFKIGPVTVGGSVLAHAFFDGYNGSPTGVPGIIAYVESQLGLPGILPVGTAAVNVPNPSLVKALVLQFTGTIAPFKIGPVTVGGSVLAHAFFDGYNGSPTGVPGITAYVTSQLGLPTSGASTAAKHAAATAAVTSVPKPAAATATISVRATKKAPPCGGCVQARRGSHDHRWAQKRASEVAQSASRGEAKIALCAACMG